MTVYNWERGYSEPRVSQFRRLARLLGVSMDELLLTGEDLGDPGPAPAGRGT